MKLCLSEKQLVKLMGELHEDDTTTASTSTDATPKTGVSDKQSGGDGYPEVTKWSDVVGAKLQRGPANQIGTTKWSDTVGSTIERGAANQLKEQKTSTPQFYTDNTQLFKGKEKPKEPIPAREVYPNYQVMDKNGKITYPFERKNLNDDYIDWFYKSPIQQYGKTGRLDDMTSYYRDDMDSWLKANMNMSLSDWENYKNRISKSGKNVPKGFNPETYDVYISKYNQLKKQITDLNKKHGLGYWDDADLKTLNNLKKQLADLTNEYSNQNFSYGITKTELEQYNNRKNEINEYYQNLLNSLKTNSSNFDREPMRSDNTRVTHIGLPNKESDIRQQWRDDLKNLDMFYGKDDWSKNVGIFGQEFDRLWDKWGDAIQIVGNLAIIALSGGIGGIVEGAAGAIGFAIESGTIRALAPYVADATFNGVVGMYQAQRGQNREALISFLCAMVPFMSYNLNIGKVSVKTAESLSRKISLAKLDSYKGMNQFIKSLTPEEKVIFRDRMTLPKEMIKKDFDKAVEQVENKLSTRGMIVPKASIKQMVPYFIKQLSAEGSIPLAGGIANALFNVIKDSDKQFTEDELIKIKQNLDEVIKNMSDNKSLLTADKILENLSKLKSSHELIAFVRNAMSYQEPTDEQMDYLTKKYNLKRKTKKIN